jgi:glyoxylase-like metal-dependent hydrolase (beta-lactamase superfamily II)
VATGVTVRGIVLSRFALDGGAMHGIIPKALWERVHAPDAKNRIALVARAILVDHAPTGSRTLIELGMGQRWSAKERAIYALEEGGGAPQVLREAGIDPDSVTHVVLTHLHWDHAGGLLCTGDDATLAFPRAEHVVGKECLAYALAATPKDAGSFRADELAVLARSPRLRLFEGSGPLAPGLVARASYGHTEGLVIPFLPARDDGPPLAVPTDLVPTRSHLEPRWVMAYDNDPRATVAEKRALIEDLARVGGGVALYHDPLIEAAWAVVGEGGAKLVPGTLDGGRTTLSGEALASPGAKTGA